MSGKYPCASTYSRKPTENGNTSSTSGTSYRKKRIKAEPERVDTLLRQVLAAHGLDKEISKYQFVLHWDEIVGEDLAKRTRPEMIRGQTLTILVSDPVWAQELTFCQEMILRRLTKWLATGQRVTSVRFRVGRT